MPRTISLGQITLTKIRNYHWRIAAAVTEEGAKYAAVTEIYVVTDDAYSAVPEGQRALPVPLTPLQQQQLNQLFRGFCLQAAEREQVEPEIIPDQA